MNEPASAKSTAELVSQFQTMMKQKDATSKFVALFILLQIHAQDQSAAAAAWHQIDLKFLDKLILSSKEDHSALCSARLNSPIGESASTSKQEAQDLQALGCSVLEAYISHPDVSSSKAFTNRGDALMKVCIGGQVSYTHPEVLCSCVRSATVIRSPKIDNILLCISHHAKGAIGLISSSSFSDFVEHCLGTNWATGISILSSTISHAVLIESSMADLFIEKIRMALSRMMDKIKTSPEVFSDYLGLLQSLSSSIPTEKLSEYLTDSDLSQIRAAIGFELLRTIKNTDHGDIMILTASIMRLQGHAFLLQDEKSEQDQKFFLLVSFLAAKEVRLSLSWLVDHNKDTVINHTLLLKVASCFDIVRINCLYLVTTDKVCLTSGNILSLRDHFKEMFGETIAYLRDRWDLSPLSSRTNQQARLLDSHSLPDINLLHDCTIISGSQSLALWLQEDESSHKEACGIMDVLLGLIRHSTNNSEIDYGTWLIPALWALLDTDLAMEQFKIADGVFIVIARLEHTYTKFLKSKMSTRSELQDAQIDVEILRKAAPVQAEKWEDSHVEFLDRIISS